MRKNTTVSPLVDLHTHSAASDGQYTPSALAALAAGRGIGVLALTDHDTVDGVGEAAAAGERLGVRVIPGVELSAREYHTFHILGYAFDPAARALGELCARMRKRRETRNQVILDYLLERGMALTLAEVERFAGGDVIGRPHFAQAMVRRGYAGSLQEAFARWLDTDEIHQRIDSGKPTARECIEAIRASGGRASLAHPYQIGIDTPALDALVRRLADDGLEAIECYYPRFTPEQQETYLKLTEKYHLHVTGGSDFHGERVKPDIALSALALDVAWLTGEE